MNIGDLLSANSRSRVSRHPNQPAQTDRKAEVVVVGKRHYSLEVQLYAEPTVRLFAIANRGQLIVFAQAESLRSSLHQLEGLLGECSPLMSKSTERVVDKAIKYGAAFSEVGATMWKPAGC